MALDNMNKFKDIDEYVKTILEKLPAILADLIMLKMTGRIWGFLGCLKHSGNGPNLIQKNLFLLKKS